MTYKKMIENQIGVYIENFVSDHADEIKIVNVDNMDLTTDRHNIEFVAKITVYNNPVTHDYRVSGYMNEFGNISICNVTYNRFVITEPGADFPHNKTYFVYGDELNAFKFDR